MRITSLQALALLSSTLIYSASWSQESIPHEELRGQIRDYLLSLHPALDESERIEVEVDNLDPRSVLRPCDRPIRLSLNGTRQPLGRVQVKIRCEGQAGWNRFVSAEVRLYQNLLVASENLSRGTILESQHIDYRELNLASVRRTPVRDSGQAVGMELKYPLTAGRAIVQEALASPKVIRRGDQVQLIAETDSLFVRQQGQALEDGEVGKLIDVRNTSSDVVVQGTVIAAGRVKVQL